ncbi:MAG: PAS domain-containing protein [Geodermatophilaceae bacterium]
MTEGTAAHLAFGDDLVDDQPRDTMTWRGGELPRPQEDLQQAFDNSPIGIAWANMAGVVVHVNRSFVECWAAAQAN